MKKKKNKINKEKFQCDVCGFVLEESTTVILDGDKCVWCDRGKLHKLPPTKVIKQLTK